MRPGGVEEEIIYQFAGYLDLGEDTSRLRIDYDGDAPDHPSSEFSPAQPGLDKIAAELEGLSGTRLLVSYRVEQPVSVKILDHSDQFPFNRIPPADNEAILADDPRPDLATGSALIIEAAPFIKVAYDNGGNQAAIQAQQINNLTDNDVAGIADDALIASLGHTDTADIVHDMYMLSHDAVPGDLSVPSFDTGALIDFFAARNAAWKEDGDTIKGGVKPGVHVNGVLQPEGAELPVPPDPFEPVLPLDAPNHGNENLPEEGEEAAEGDAPSQASSHIGAPADSPAQVAVLGANDVVNGGAIVDVNHATGTMVVFGDYFKTDAIIQTIAYMDDDKITHAGGGSPDFETGGNQANNIATFLETDPGVGSFAGTGIFAGTDWKVDVFDGDLYDVRSISQKIWLEDNDISFQDNDQTYYQLLAGANEQGNFATFHTVIADYDLVFVMGDYHQANLITQKIVLLDPDTLEVLSSMDIAQGGGAAGPSALTGENWMLNEATIENYSTSIVNPVTQDWHDLAGDLLNETKGLDLEDGMGIPNFGDGTLDILLVTGSIYDLNVIDQEIVVSDADTAMQFLSDDAGGVAQSAITGGNQLTNTATIINTGPAADFYVGGETYDEELLINAEILASDDDDVIHGDPNQLASELVAFATPPAGEGEDQVEEFGPAPGTGEGDLLGGTLG